MKKTKIICSIGPSSNEPDVMENMVRAGMDVARINFSHATIEEREKCVASVKEVRKRTGANIAILYDSKGPEFRSGMLENGEITLVEGKTIRIVKEQVLGNEERISVNHPSALDSISVGNVILLENGLMKVEVISKEEDGLTCKIVVGGVLGNKKSLSVPDVLLSMPYVSEQDREDIIYACHHDGDILAISFVSTKENVLEVREILKENGREDMPIIFKIENGVGVENLEEIRQINHILEEYYQFFAGCDKEIQVVEASECDYYFTDAQYEYGAIPSHLNELVNQKIAGLIERSIGI